MSLSVDGTWKAGVWNTTVWADGVWLEGRLKVGIPGGKGDSGREDEELRKALAYQAEQRMRIRDEQDAMDALDFMMTFLQGERDASS